VSTLTRDPKQRTAMMLALIALAMVGLGFASVPLYRLFCQVTGFNGTTQRGLKAPGAISGKTMTIRFDANHAPNLPWSFKPEQPTQGVTVGEREQAIFVATNNGSKPVTGTATFNVTPTQAGKYFTKIQCFCFTQQTLQPGESARMPVIYYVDPKILDDADARDVEEITLSYTFYPVADQPKAG
jgi:cytochrome c oxidase assembly protein subunit 11